MAYPWAEYWDFLKCFTDLCEEDGLSRLEEYLRKAVREKKEKSWIDLQSPASVTACIKGQRSGGDPNASPETSADRLSEKSPVCNLMNKFEKTSLLQAAQDSGLGGLTLSASDDDDDRGGAWGLSQGGGDDSGSDEYYSADEDVDAPCQAEGGERRAAQHLGCTGAPRSRSSSVSSRSSYKSTHSSPEDDEAFWENIFLAGDSPSKLDHEVLVAMGGMDLDQRRYPCVARWKNVVLSYPESQRSRWPNRTSESQTSTPRTPTRGWLTGSPRILSAKKFSSPTQQFKPRTLC